MKAKKHAIGKAKARKMTEAFAEACKKKKTLRDLLPEAFGFEAAQVRSLLNHPEARWFVVEMGLKSSTRNGVATEEISPILKVLNEAGEVIEQGKKSASSEGAAAMMASFDDGDGDGGGYLDEAQRYPPWPNA